MFSDQQVDESPNHATGELTPAKPVLVYDGDCAFCRKWIARWQVLTDDRVEYAPYQQVAEQYSHIPPDEFTKAVYLIEPDGATYRAAEAVLRSLSDVRGRRWMYGAYRRVPLVRPISERAYRFVAEHRRGLSWITRCLWGNDLSPSTYHLTRWLFLRLLGVIYLIAFASLAVQILGLVGSNGILPVAPYLDRVYNRLGSEAYLRLPTLCWFDSSDTMLRGLCFGGMAASVLLILRVTPTLMLIALWMLYLSLTVAGRVFLNFQWDILLLEAGFLAIFFAPLRLWPRLSTERAPSRIVMFLMCWLLFRLMFLSGAVKLTYDDQTWWNLSALTYHYETTPLPTWTGWYAHHLPVWCHTISCAVMYVIELVMPFFIFAPRRLRMLAGFAIVFFMVLIGLTGNYNFFNLVTVALCLLLFDDRFLSRFFPRRVRAQVPIAPLPRRRTPWRTVMLSVLAVFVVAVTTARGFDRFTRRTTLPKSVQRWLAPIRPFRSFNSYGLFRTMTTSRPEIVLEGSDDGRNWLAYEFHWKPGDLMRRPRFVQPHQPRLDWQMWFAALGNVQRNHWVVSLMQRLLEGSPEVLAFFEKNPFPEMAPLYVRAVLYDYHFSDPQTRSETGAWWTRKRLGLYARP
ncbi:MAG: lipase maturation factor family protein, partial [Planctomycetes bacterium]|nr:lipase maturation factor family protein [Planctomycetota bacterium]